MIDLLKTLAKSAHVRCDIPIHAWTRVFHMDVKWIVKASISKTSYAMDITWHHMSTWIVAAKLPIILALPHKDANICTHQLVSLTSCAFECWNHPQSVCIQADLFYSKNILEVITGSILLLLYTPSITYGTAFG